MRNCVAERARTEDRTELGTHVACEDCQAPSRAPKTPRPSRNRWHADPAAENKPLSPPAGVSLIDSRTWVQTRGFPLYRILVISDFVYVISIYDSESDLGDFPFRMKNILDSLLGTPAANKITKPHRVLAQVKINRRVDLQQL